MQGSWHPGQHVNWFACQSEPAAHQHLVKWPRIRYPGMHNVAMVYKTERRGTALSRAPIRYNELHCHFICKLQGLGSNTYKLARTMQKSKTCATHHLLLYKRGVVPSLLTCVHRNMLACMQHMCSCSCTCTTATSSAQSHSFTSYCEKQPSSAPMHRGCQCWSQTEASQTLTLQLCHNKLSCAVYLSLHSPSVACYQML